jgi:pantoate--beta-alanine ligase
MKVASTVAALRASVGPFRAAGQRVVFVPTMGNLHAGHRRLLREARSHGDAVVASVFVNPMQFDRAEDLASYPRTPEQDLAALETEGVALVFMPAVEEIYPRPLEQMTFVEVPGLAGVLEGAHRPGHFRGVATVVNRLFNLVQPDVALFGKKDYQQLLVIRRMVGDLGLPVEIVGIDTVREDDGLAMSSRNAYLTTAERAAAPTLYGTLCAVRDGLVAGEPAGDLEAAAVRRLEKAGFRPDYITIRRRTDLAVPDSLDRELIVLVAAFLGHARLIDNLELDLNRAG